VSLSTLLWSACLGGGNLIVLDAAAYFLDIGFVAAYPVVLDGRRTFCPKTDGGPESGTPPIWGLPPKRSSLT
jgi:hypothetical protein